MGHIGWHLSQISRPLSRHWPMSIGECSLFTFNFDFQRMHLVIMSARVGMSHWLSHLETHGDCSWNLLFIDVFSLASVLFGSTDISLRPVALCSTVEQLKSVALAKTALEALWCALTEVPDPDHGSVGPCIVRCACLPLSLPNHTS